MRSLFFTHGCVIILLLLSGCGVEKVHFTSKDRQLLLADAVLSFRQRGLHDLQPALEQFATPKAAEKFATFDRKIWDFANPTAGWSYLLNTSVIAFGNLEGENPIVAFYHPWSDVFLLTSWQVDAEGPRIADVEMLMGDFVRNRGGPPLPPSPLWVRMPMFKPLAVGIETSESVRAFEQIFPVKIQGDWRKQIPNLGDPDLVEEVNYAGVSLLLAQNIAEIEEFSRAGKDDDVRLAAVRKETARLLDSGKEGKMKSILAGAQETLPAARQAMLRIAPETFSTYRPVSFLLGSDACIVFLAPTGSADYFISCVFKGKNSKQKLMRVDLVSYAVLYREGPKLLADAGDGS